MRHAVTVYRGRRLQRQSFPSISASFLATSVLPAVEVFYELSEFQKLVKMGRLPKVMKNTHNRGLLHAPGQTTSGQAALGAVKNGKSFVGLSQLWTTVLNSFR